VKAFVLAGGLGTRLRPQFGELPKGLAPVAGRPFLTHQLEWLVGHGIRDVVVCAGYGAEQVRRELGDGRAFGARVEYSIEETPLGTGGALHHARRFMNGPALVLNGDTLVACDPWALERARWESGALGALAVYEVSDAASRGRVECDAAGRIVRFVEKDSNFVGPALVNGGLYAFSPEVWRRMPPASAPSDEATPVFSLERDILPALAEAGSLSGVTFGGEFFDIGTPEEWARAERRFSA
jgi:D-glycero-alpha-D-manno-heptose 1-phosphate guanylyltransferase